MYDSPYDYEKDQYHLISKLVNYLFNIETTV